MIHQSKLLLRLNACSPRPPVRTGREATDHPGGGDSRPHQLARDRRLPPTPPPHTRAHRDRPRPPATTSTTRFLSATEMGLRRLLPGLLVLLAVGMASATETDTGTDTDAACDSDVWYTMSFLALAFALANFVIWCAEGFRVRCTVCRPLYLPAHSRERPLRR